MSTTCFVCAYRRQKTCKSTPASFLFLHRFLQAVLLSRAEISSGPAVLQFLGTSPSPFLLCFVNFTPSPLCFPTGALSQSALSSSSSSTLQPLQSPGREGGSPRKGRAFELYVGALPMYIASGDIVRLTNDIALLALSCSVLSSCCSFLHLFPKPRFCLPLPVCCKR